MNVKVAGYEVVEEDVDGFCIRFADKTLENLVLETREVAEELCLWLNSGGAEFVSSFSR